MVSSTVVRQRLDELKHTFELALFTAVTPSNSGPFLPPSYPACDQVFSRPHGFRSSESIQTKLFFSTTAHQRAMAAPATAADTAQPRRPRVLVAASGSVAAIKFGSLCRGLAEWADVRAVVTGSSLHFIDRVSFPSVVALLTDDDEWSAWRKIGDEVLHIELRKWADAMVIAPLSANTLAKIAGGLCDNLLTCVVRAWDYSKPVYVAPAMNTFMWDNPFTRRHLDVVCELGMSLIPPVTKRLACGDYGNGAMQEPSEICRTVRLFFGPQDRQLLQLN